MYTNIEEKAYKQKKRKGFLEAGFELFSTKSIESVTLQEVADKSGYGVATLYRYFDSKSRLLLEISAWKWGEFFAENRTRRPKEGFDNATAAEMFDFYLDSFIAVFVNNKPLLRFNQLFNIYLQSESADDATLKMYRNLMAPIINFFHEFYEKAKVDGTLRTEIPEEEMLSTTVHLMLAAITRYAVGLVYEPEGSFDPVKELQTLREMLCLRYKA